MVARGWQHLRIVCTLFLLLGLLGGCVNGLKKSASLNNGGSALDFDPHSARLEVRPLEASLPVGKQILLLATVYDDENKPRKKRKVEWKIEGPGIILEYDQGGTLRGHGFKEDSKSAVTFTETSEHRLPPGIDNPLGQTVSAGQTWCVISSAVEGQTIVHAYAPEIADSHLNRILVRLNWVDARWQFPKSASARVGTEQILTTAITQANDRSATSPYRVRYTLINEGPEGSLYLTPAQRAEKAREVIVPVDAEGLARIRLASLKPEAGTNRVRVEVLRPDLTIDGMNQRNGFSVIAKTETKIDWQAPELKLTIETPKTAPLSQAFPITFSAISPNSAENAPMVMRTALPLGLELVNAVPKATADGNDLLWSLPALPGGTQQTVQIIVRPTRVGNFTFAATARTTDNLKAESVANLQVTESRLGATLSGPQTALVGESLRYQVDVNNFGSGPATNIKVRAEHVGLELIGKPGPFEVIIDKLDGGQKQTILLPLSPLRAGKSVIKATVLADGAPQIETPAVGIDIRKPDLKLIASAPERAYLDQEVTWTLRIENPGDVPFGNILVRAQLPPDVRFVSATNNGREVNGAIEWNIGTAVGKQWTDVKVTGLPKQLGRTALIATVTGEPLDKREGDFKQVSLVRNFGGERVESPVEILGVPALQLELFDSVDPIAMGQKLTYTIRVRNAGTIADNQIEIVAELPPQLKPLRAFGASNGRIEGKRIVFAPIASLKPNVLSVFTIEAQAEGEGDGRVRVELKSLSLRSPLSAEESTRVLPNR